MSFSIKEQKHKIKTTAKTKTKGKTNTSKLDFTLSRFDLERESNHYFHASSLKRAPNY